MKYIVTIIFTLALLSSVYSNDIEWKFDNPTKAGFKSTTGKQPAVLKGNCASKSLLAPGLYGNAVKFKDGKYQLKIEHSKALNLKNNFTITAIFKPERIDSYRTLLWKGNRSPKPQLINYWLSFKDGKPEFKFKDRNGKWTVASTGKGLIKVGKWYHFTVTMDDKGLILGYLNGKQCFRKSYKPGALAINNQPAYIGTGESYAGGGIGYPFIGLIDQITITSGVTPPSAAAIREFNKLKKLAEVKADVTAKKKRQIDMKIIKSSLGSSQYKLSTMTTDELKSLANKVRYNKFFTKHAKGQAMIISVLPTASRILNVNDYVAGKFSLQDRVNISAARNEYEGFQLILLGNPERELKNITIKPSELISATGNIIAPSKIEWGFIRSIKTSKPKYDIDYIGDYPDAIMEGQQQAVTVPKNGFAPVYLRVQIDNDVAPGNYQGIIKVGSQSIAVNLRVYDFTLPVTSSIKIVFSFFESFYKKWYNKLELTDSEKMGIYDFLLKYRITPNNIYAGNIYPELKFMPELKKKGANFCTLGYLKRNKPVSQQELQAIITDYRARFNAVKAAGFKDMAYLYAFDEIEMQKQAEQDASQQIMPALKQALPELKTIQTSRPYLKILDTFDIWIPLFGYFVGNEKILNTVRQRGKKLWWYSADQPLSPLPNFFLDYPVINNRIIFTLSYMYNVEGVLYWCVNREWATNMDIKGEWPNKPWKSYIINIFTKKRVYKNGMGNYIYPGKDGRLLPSLRLENLRDGIEDYEYLVLLKKLIANSPKSALRQQAKKLLKVPADVAQAVNQYSTNPKYLINYRNQVALMIEKLKKSSK